MSLVFSSSGGNEGHLAVIVFAWPESVGRWDNGVSERIYYSVFEKREQMQTHATCQLPYFQLSHVTVRPWSTRQKWTRCVYFLIDIKMIKTWISATEWETLLLVHGSSSPSQMFLLNLCVWEIKMNVDHRGETWIWVNLMRVHIDTNLSSGWDIFEISSGTLMTFVRFLPFFSKEKYRRRKWDFRKVSIKCSQFNVTDV